MLPADTISETFDPETVTVVPLRNRVSLWIVLVVQALNSFSDSFVKMLVIVFAHAVAKGAKIGDDVQIFMGFIFSLPFVFFAPLAGYVSDRQSKQRVIFWMQAAQVVIFAGLMGSLMLQNVALKTTLTAVTLFLLATQEAFFTPARMGIMKDLIGSRGLGMASGVQQMSMFAAILAGYALAGEWFGRQIGAGVDPWRAMQVALGAATGLAVLQTIGAAFVQRTASHHDAPWRASLLWEHFGSLRAVFKAPAVGLAGLGIVFFWFMCNGVGSILVGLCNEAFVVEEVSSKMKGIFSLLLGLGVVLGCLLSSVLCRKSIRMGIVPAAIFALTGVLVLAMVVPAQSKVEWLVMVLIGFTAGLFMVPLYGFIQDRAAAHERSKVLAGVSLIDCLGGTVASLLVWGLLTARMPSAMQLGIMSAISLAAAFFMLRLRRYRDH